jgi:hypothetical protein
LIYFLRPAKTKRPTAIADSKSDTTKYPYTVKDAIDWQMNKDPQNLLVAMRAVKAFENQDTTALKELIGGSIVLMVDGY